MTGKQSREVILFISLRFQLNVSRIFELKVFEKITTITVHVSLVYTIDYVIHTTISDLASVPYHLTNYTQIN